MSRSAARLASVLAQVARRGSPSLQASLGAQLPGLNAALTGIAPAFSTSAATSVQRSWAAQDEEESWSPRILYPDTEVSVGAPAPAWKAPAVVDGEFTTVSLSQYRGKWVVLFFYPKDFTFVCPTEIIAFSDRAKEFEALNTQLIAASTDTEETHLAWIRTPRKKGGLGHLQIPIIADTTKEIAARYGVLIEDKGIALRGLFIVNPEGVVEQVTINNLGIGRSVDETLRLLAAYQFVAKHGEVCPANWKPGDKSMIADTEKSLDYFSTVQDQDAEQGFGNKVKPITSKKEYEAAIASGKPVVVDFYAPWCGKCRQIGPFLDTLVDKYPGVTFLKVDTTAEALETLSADQGVKTLPAFKFYKGGKEVQAPVTGYKKKLLEDGVQALTK